MSVEFQLDHQDHHKVEDFLARGSSGVAAIALHPKAAAHQQAAAEAAIAAGIDVLYDPRTERLAYPGHGLDRLPGYVGAPFDINQLALNLSHRQRLVEAVVEAHPDFSTVLTPPHFYVDGMRAGRLNLALAEATILATDKPVRPVLMLKSRFSHDDAGTLAAEYSDAGFTQIDLRFTPLGGEGDGIPKIRSAFKIADIFRTAGMRVILGRSGNIGQAAFALGHVDGYSMGIGQMEHVSHAADIARQKRPHVLDQDGKRKGGIWQGVYLPGLAATVSMKRARQLLENSDVRTRLGCRIDGCANSLLGPVIDHKSHYLHSRASDVTRLLQTPPHWRPKLETDRLRRALELRELVNDSYRAPESPPMPTRTLKSLLDGIEEERATSVA